MAYRINIALPVKMILISLLLSVSGCSGSGKIADAMAKLRNEAGELQSRLAIVAESNNKIISSLPPTPGFVGPPSPVSLEQTVRSEAPKISQAVSESEQIVANVVQQTEVASQALTTVDDKTPAWLTGIKLLAILAGCVVAIVGLFYFGPFISRWLGVLSPAKRSEANLLQDAMNDPDRLPEFTAAWRAKNGNEGAYRSVKKSRAKATAKENPDAPGV